MSPFRKVLIANRGEIAVRVIRTLRDMGIASVAVYSDADRSAPHVRMADEAYPIGPAPSAESYLSIDNILHACRLSGADAVHPGYGFLSERADFARACGEHGLVFIGPPPAAIETMGWKTTARACMETAGVPVVPGATATSVDALGREADRIGYPVMLKASAGGGGKGMRLVEQREDFATAFSRCQSEALNAFGNEAVYIEKALDRPRHLEIQLLADQHGQVLHLFERDCSIQRRHQKVIEESPSPSPFASAAKVSEMGAVAVRAAKAVEYVGAGTVEFLMTGEGEFYFLEMNTRLQVEHPITELCTGIDLVREQVRIAAGEPLGYSQADVQRRGHAIECRIYAENPRSNFLPSPGRISLLRRPAGPGVRDDSGAYEGLEISPNYDPLISKLCIWARDRPQAIARMERALGEYLVGGIDTNLAYHQAIMRCEEFREGNYDTGFLERHHTALIEPMSAADSAEALAIAAAMAHEFQHRDANAETQGEWSDGARNDQPSPWRLASLSRLRRRL